MKPVTIVAPYAPGPFLEKALLPMVTSDLVEQIVVISQEPIHLAIEKCRVLSAGPLSSGETLNRILGEIRSKYVLFFPAARSIYIEPGAVEKFLDAAESGKAGLIYSDFYDETEHAKILHPLNDYQPGSVRDDFDFGFAVLYSVSAIREAVEKYGLIPDGEFSGLYDLRLKVSIDHSLLHLPEPLYSVLLPLPSFSKIPPTPLYKRGERGDFQGEGRGEGREEFLGTEKMFAYVDPRNIAAQKEMEAVFTDYLKKIGAYLPPHRLKEVERTQDSFPVLASVVIPILNRRETIADAVKSALSQETDFPFNVIVVDNHSTDGTTVILSELSRQYSGLKHIIPLRTDLGIGGCWNEALRTAACGRYAVQLDSDDLYSSEKTLQKIVERLPQGNYAMVIGSYTLVDSRLKEIPPGLIDHREWTDENGHNNALRVNGLGAPRAFDTVLLRRIGFPNVSYGEDYAVALRICREYRIGRIYESLYLCRRWPGNTDAALGIVETNRNNAFKDRIRTDEIIARKKMAKSGQNLPSPLFFKEG